MTGGSDPRGAAGDAGADADADERTLASIVALHDDGVPLPVLAAVRADFERRLERDGLRPRPAPAVAAVAVHAPRLPRRHAPRRGHRVARRTAVTLLLIFLIGATAIAASTLVGGDAPPPTTDPTTLTTAGRGLARRTLAAYGNAGQVCVAVRSADSLASACANPPATGGVRVLSAHGPLARSVVGLAGHRVAQVVVRSGGVTRTLPTHALPRAGDLPDGLRWFSASFPAARTAGAEPPARVTPLDSGGRRLRRSILDCSLGAQAAACRRAAGG